ncbi:MAG: 50S ribosomal protein L13 [Candidatus Doudnabacteria bacterium]|nr:50S ribosomal protein L13 [bacterium]MDZ4244007.1 50S ribosomal protein L13 [Candidatus Doudnabacteria bacterium]
MNQTYLPKTSDIKRRWYEIDASKFTLGRLATRVASLLRGKHKASFTPHMDVGDFVVVTNAEKIKLTGRKILQKEYFRFSGYPGGIKREILRDVLKKKPEDVVYRAVRNMLAVNRLRKPILKRLKIVRNDKHNFNIDKKIS